MSNPWDRYKGTGMESGAFKLMIADGSQPASVGAQVEDFRRAMIARAKFNAQAHHGIPQYDVFLDGVTKRALGWGVLRIWCWLLVKRRAWDLNHRRLWPWQLSRALHGGMPVYGFETRRTGGTWTSDGPVTEPLWVADDKRAREGGQA